MPESNVCIAKVSITSVLPQLDRLFDYQLPLELRQGAAPGVRVKVPFGRSKKLQDGFIVELSENTDYPGELGSIVEIVSSVPVLQPEIYRLARAVADRQAATLTEVLRHAIPDRSVAIEKSWLEKQAMNRPSLIQGAGQSLIASSPDAKSEVGAARTTQIVEPRVLSNGAQWTKEILDLTSAQHKQKKSTLIIVPDARDQSLLLAALAESELADDTVDYSSKLLKSKRYKAFLDCLSKELSIVVGSRSTIFAPVRNLGQIIIWDDGDHSHKDQSAPYSHTRDIALIKQQQENCELHFLGHVRSTEVERLRQIGYVTENSKGFTPPNLLFSESESRVDSAAWVAIREGLAKGPVLVQVSTRGTSASVFCKDCHARAKCRTCNGPLWIDAGNQILCRWCAANNLNFSCHECKGSKISSGRAGSARTLSDFGKAFPGHAIVESTGDSPRFSIKRSKCVVVCTPGAEPFVEGGYEAVVILDAPKALASDSLRATEEAIRSWSNAIALLGSSGRAVIVGLSGVLADKLALWAQADIASFEFRVRSELRFPPALRLASLGAEKNLIAELLPVLETLPGVEVLGPVKVFSRGLEIESKLLLKYEYSVGAELAKTLQAEVAKLSAGNSRNNLRTGKSMRPIRIKMDDFDVL